MKHIKKHPINDKSQKLSKDMKKQELVKPKTDKILDADKSLSDPKISKRVVKPSNKKLSSEKHLSGKKAKKVNENIELKNLKRFNEFLDPMGKWTKEESEKESDVKCSNCGCYGCECYNCGCCLHDEPKIEVDLYGDEPESVGSVKCPKCGCNN